MHSIQVLEPAAPAPPPGMLSDGTNPEGVDPEPTLNWAREDLTNVMLYGNFNSPSTMKVRLYLMHHRIAFEHVNVNPPVKGFVYTKVPVLVVNGKAVNDSAVIIKQLAAALGQPFDAPWEERLAYSLHPSFFYMMSPEETWQAWTASTGPAAGMPRCLGCCLGRVAVGLCKKMADATRDAVGETRYAIVPPRQLADEFRAALGKRPYFHGAAPAHVDLSLYGMLAVWHDVAKFPLVLEMITGSGLSEWWTRMGTQVPGAFVSSELHFKGAD